MFFDGWTDILRVLIVGTAAYVSLVVLLRVSGKRTLSKMNAFDFIVTVALGSTLATVLLSGDVALAEGLVALGLLIFLQLGVTWLSVRWPRFRSAVKAEPALVFYRGRFLDAALRRERVTQDEVRAAAREQGVASLSEVDSVVLETNGSLAVQKRDGGDGSAMRGVSGYEAARGAGAGAPE